MTTKKPGIVLVLLPWQIGRLLRVVRWANICLFDQGSLLLERY
jgi:hypothetical protein